MVPNTDMNHKALAAHFKHSNEAMRKYEARESKLWSVYVKAYNWDKHQESLHVKCQHGMEGIKCQPLG